MINRLGGVALDASLKDAVSDLLARVLEAKFEIAVFQDWPWCSKVILNVHF